MRKNFTLVSENKQRDRVLDAVKHEIRKYLRRERKRDVPAGSDHWEFDCRFGLTQEAAEAVPLDALIDKVGSVAAEGADAFYVEILARPAVKTAHERKSTAAADDPVDPEQDL
ncbi:hypothetical protein SAMN05192589_10310 [Paracidovorax valerianellae]|uniref:Uncharacterized protein n=1 Tax=Paracidovorax valerianellae TaxID=187868 RepID=A0A1G6NQH9_9BURK|nr:DUF6172 family protein [Paracidovorax valerianellae]SDC69425.1 hypothetical protein SAMN05192589_10310 [Paracidovorax valerianellae]